MNRRMDSLKTFCELVIMFYVSFYDGVMYKFVSYFFIIFISVQYLPLLGSLISILHNRDSARRALLSGYLDSNFMVTPVVLVLGVHHRHCNLEFVFTTCRNLASGKQPQETSSLQDQHHWQINRQFRCSWINTCMVQCARVDALISLFSC